MAYSKKAIANFVADQKLPSNEATAINERADKAAEEFGPGGDAFSDGKIEYVLGSAERARAFQDAREHNLERYGR